MTDEQRKQIEGRECAKDAFIRTCLEYLWPDGLVNKADVDAFLVNYKNYESELDGEEFGPSLSDNRVKELERGLIEIKSILMYQSSNYARDIHNKIDKLLTPNENDKEQKG